MANSKNNVTEIKSGFFSRTMSVTKMVSGSALKLAQAKVSGSVSDNEVDPSYEAIGQLLTEELGNLKGLLMKAGQMASYLSPAVPKEIREQLELLQDSSTPMPFEQVLQILQTELGCDPFSVFADIDKDSVHAASIGQVHRGRLPSGEEVAIKVQYPGIEEAIGNDLQNAKVLRPLFKMLFPGVDHGAMLAELQERSLEECDYQREADNQQLFYEIFANENDIIIPRVYKELGTRRVLVSEWVDGQSLRKFMVTSSAADRDRVGASIHKFLAHSIFGNGVFNADPHPGNFLVCEEGVVFLDYGCVKHWDEEFMERWKNLVRAALKNDFDGWKESWIKMGFVANSEKFDFDTEFEFYRDMIGHLIHDEPNRIEREQIEKTNRKILLSKNHRHISMPKDFLLVIRINFGVASLLANLNSRHYYRGDVIPFL